MLGSSEALFRVLTAHTPVGVFVSNAEGQCVYVNERWCELAGLTGEHALGDGWMAALHPDDAERVLREWAQASGDGRDSIVEYRFLRPNGEVSWIQGFASALRDDRQAVAGWVGTCLDLTARKQAELELRHLADHDSLTGLLNRRRFHEELERELGRVLRSDGRAGLLVLDVDRFKRVNDSLGHRAGDEVLRAIAETLTRRLRATDVIARLGGDEFAALVTDLAGPDDARLIACEIAASVRSQTILTGAGPVSVTISIGIVEFDASTAARGDDLVAIADRGLYLAKRRGRDRAELVA